MKKLIVAVAVLLSLTVHTAKAQTPTKWRAVVAWHFYFRSVIITYQEINGQYVPVRTDTSRIGIKEYIDSLIPGVRYKFRVLPLDPNYFATFYPFASTLQTATPVMFRYPPEQRTYGGLNVVVTLIPRILNVNYWERELPPGAFPFKSKIVNVDDPIDNQVVEIK